MIQPYGGVVPQGIKAPTSDADSIVDIFKGHKT